MKFLQSFAFGGFSKCSIYIKESEIMTVVAPYVKHVQRFTTNLFGLFVTMKYRIIPCLFIRYADYNCHQMSLDASNEN